MKSNHTITVVCLLFIIGINAQELPELLQKKIETIQQRDSLFGITAAVMSGDNIIWTGTAGYSNPSTGDTVTADMNGSIGSNTKMMTSTIILELVEEGKLSLDDSIDKWFTPSVKIPGNVTVHQLLNHTSGIADYTTEAWVDSFKANPSKVWTVDDLIDTFVGEPDFAPGTSWKYSNTGYLLLGKIIESIENKTYREVLYERILNPLQLTTMYTPIQDEPTGPVMTPWFDIDDDGMRDNLLEYSLTAMHTSGWSAGYIYSTPLDLAKFLRELFTGNLLEESSLNEMKTSPPTKSDYGLGLAKFNFFNKTFYGHTGQYLGYLAYSGYEPESGLSVAVLLNITYADILGIGEEITKLAYDNLITDLEVNQNLISTFYLSQNYPNPFNPSTIIKYSVPATSHVTLKVYDVLGREVANLVENVKTAGSYSINYDASKLSSGIYLYTIKAGDFTKTKKMVLMH